jgi:thiosulfate/3-mercaptopyruvate sulfurtransferase
VFAALAGGRPLRLLDVRWQLGCSDNWAGYLAAHLPGAVYVDLDTELASPPTAELGRHPLPTRANLERAARRWGLNGGERVVVYDGGGNYSSARLWWLLADAGVDGVSVLDGALPAWIAAGLATESGDVVPSPGTIRFDRGHRLPVLDIDQAAGLPAAGGVLLDARALERYLGLTEPIDPRPGHIPGAVSAPTGDNLDDDGRFLPAHTLRERFAALGVGPGTRVGAYCGSGITASHEVLALHLVGLGAALYPGSWSQWSHTDRPAATGKESASRQRP